MKSFIDKLDRRLSINEHLNLLDQLLIDRPERFTNRSELKQYLSEGAALQFNTIGQAALSVPCGKYIVWATDNGNTMLIPANEVRAQDNVHEHKTQYYEVYTKDLLDAFSGVERILREAEDEDTEDFEDMDDEDEAKAKVGGKASEMDEAESATGDSGDSTAGIEHETVDRTPIVTAMQQMGHTVTSLADACGVDPPAISRILRVPKETGKDPGGRNPSIGLAAKIASELRMEAEALFPDIFGGKQKLEPKKVKANRGSGNTNTRKKR